MHGGSQEVYALRGQQGYQGIRGHWGAGRRYRGCLGPSEGVGVSEVQWEQAVSVGAQEPVGLLGHQGHWGLVGGVGASGSDRVCRGCLDALAAWQGV